MEIKIIINEGGAGRVRRGARFMDKDSRRGRKFGRRGLGGHRHGEWGHGRHEARHGGEAWREGEGQRHGCRRRAHVEGEATAREGGRVIGKLVELPDGRIRVVKRRGEGGRRHDRLGHDGERKHDGPRHERVSRHGRRHGERLERGAGARYNEEEREARRARRRLIRQIVRAIESGEFGEA